MNLDFVDVFFEMSSMSTRDNNVSMFLKNIDTFC